MCAFDHTTGFISAVSFWLNRVTGVTKLCIGGRRGGKQIQVYMRKISVANTSIKLYRHTNFEIKRYRYFLISSTKESIIPCTSSFITQKKGANFTRQIFTKRSCSVTANLTVSGRRTSRLIQRNEMVAVGSVIQDTVRINTQPCRWWWR
jgi:hypothetical protein